MSSLFKLVDPKATMPVRATPGSAGYDLFALESREIKGGEGSVLVPTGIAVEIPPGHYARIAPRSGLALKQHLAVNAGVIDADYFPNPVGVILYCTKNDHSYTVNAGDRFAQIIITKIYDDSSDVSVLQHTLQNAPQRHISQHAGFGSTGK